MDLKEKKVLVFGAGKSGIGAADLLGSAGAQPVIYDGNADLDKEAVLHKTNGKYTPEIWAGDFPERALDSLDLVVLSPGVPTDLPLVKSFYEKGLPVWSEVSLPIVQARERFLRSQEPTARQQQQHSSERSWEMPVNLYLL